MSSKQDTHISALEPTNHGHQFVFYGDCCSGVPGGSTEANFAAVNAVIARLSPQPEFILFLGDHIRGMTDDYDDLRNQWRYWQEHEMAWLDSDVVPVYHLTSNHNTYSEESEDVWREVIPDIPDNGPPDQKGLSYFIRRNDLLIVMANTSFSGLGGYGHVECDWLDTVLTENEDARWKLVCGHHPVFPVNGYDERPLWTINEAQGEAFWKVLVKHRVLAYLCSHIIAYDVQEHEGIVQICTGGAGTEFGPGGFMKCRLGCLHAVQAVLDESGLRCQVLDTEGEVRDTLHWETPAT